MICMIVRIHTNELQMCLTKKELFEYDLSTNQYTN